MIHPGDRIFKTISGFIFFHFRSPCRMLILEVLSAFHLLSLFCSMLDFLRQIGSKCRKSHPQTRQIILPYHLLPEPVIMGCSTVMIVPRVKMVFFFLKTSWWYLCDYLVIMIFDVYWCFKHLFDLRIFIIWKAQCCFFFHLQSEAKLNVRFTLIFILIIYTRWQIVKRGGGFLLGHTLKPCVPWSYLTGLAPNCPSLTFGPKFGLASNIDLLSNLVVSNLVTS